MKRLAVILTLAFSLVGFSSFANGEDLAPAAAVQSFKNSFKTATEVSWSATESFHKVSFFLNGQPVSAFYSAQGEMIAITRSINSLQLPIALQASLKKDYDAYWISDLFEMANEEGTSYFITLENADTKLVLKSTAASEWTSFRKQRKS
ncbi:MAG TPA: hypothetical protein VFR58_03955 [Flavisolibacter sp.]|nr:hypothetical protein [Flavisolibacter sp.]